jgi:hypothetical protein
MDLSAPPTRGESDDSPLYATKKLKFPNSQFDWLTVMSEVEGLGGFKIAR